MRKHKPPWLKRIRLAVTGVVMAITMAVAPAAMADLNGYDVSGYQAPDITQVAPADFAIVKVNQGWYINSSWGQQASGAVNTGKELGLYDYASGMDATTEADNFVNHITGYVGKAMLVLDWEPYQNAAWGNSNWVRTWVYRVHARTGVWPVVYCSKGFVGQIPADVRAKCMLWAAQYANNYATGYQDSPWLAGSQGEGMLQYTSTGYLNGHGPLDLDKFFGDRTAWRKIACGERAGEVVEGVMDVIAKDSNPVTVKLEPEKVNGLLGTDVSREEMVRILESLDFTVEGDTIHVPSWRSDVEHYSDIAEEVARFYGYNNIPDTLSNGLTARRGLTDIQQTENLLGSVCRAAGYDEIITYSFISPTYYDKIDLPKDSPLRDSLKILNPLGEDTSIMRTTTLPSMLEILTRNYNFRNKSAKLYELGRVYFKRADGLADEPKVLTLGAYGDGMDFFTLKGAVEAVLKQLRIENVRFLADSENPSYHPGRCAKVFSGDRLLGVLGQIHPHVAGNYGVDAELYAAELRFDALYESKGSQPLYQPLPKFPAVTRDIAVVCDKAVTVGELEDAILKGAKGLLKDVALFDIYTGTGIAPGKKSVAFNLTLRADDRSLTAEEADADVKSILTALEQECGAVLR